MSDTLERYVGRFAPSPTGPLHAGSLVAALASYVDARAAQGRWLIRIEDVDRARSLRTHEAEILRQLAAFGLEPDEPPTRQSERAEGYREVLRRLESMHATYPCRCSRSTLAHAKRNREGEAIYPGTCRPDTRPRNGPVATAPTETRVRASLRIDIGALELDSTISFSDRVHGEVTQDVANEVGDFVLLRADGDFAYQLAVVVDDELQGVTDVVRGADLLLNTPRQRLLQRALGYRALRYAHIPLVTNEAGEKLSKQTLAPPLATDRESVMRALRDAWRHLKQAPIDQASSPVHFLAQATHAWSIASLRSDRSKPAATIALQTAA